MIEGLLKKYFWVAVYHGAHTRIPQNSTGWSHRVSDLSEGGLG